MEDRMEVAIFISPEIEEVFADNGVDVISILREEELDVQRGKAIARVSAASGLKEPVSIILASAFVISVLTPIITKAITALSGKQVLVTERILAPVETSDGKVVCDAEGNPILQWIDKTSIVESGVRSTDTVSANVETPLGFKFSFKAESNG